MGIKEIGASYQENFEDVLRDANLQGKTCQVWLEGGLNIVGKVKTVDVNAVQL